MALDTNWDVARIVRNYTTVLGEYDTHLRTLATSPAVDWPFMAWQWPVGAAIFYLISVFVLEQVKPARDPNRPRSRVFEPTPFNVFIVAHNAVLMIFSVLTFIHTFPALVNPIMEHGYPEGICKYTKLALPADTDNVLWWNYLFYVSKIYEVLDTYIIVWRGAKPTVLQVFHHAGAIVCMWVSVAAGSRNTWLFTVYNAFIHSLLYAWFMTSALKLNVRCFRPIMTTLQLLQFIFGSAMAFSYFQWGDNCQTRLEYFTLAFNEVYVIALIVLFANFFYQQYVASPKKQKKN